MNTASLVERLQQFAYHKTPSNKEETIHIWQMFVANKISVLHCLVCDHTEQNEQIEQRNDIRARCFVVSEPY